MSTAIIIAVFSALLGGICAELAGAEPRLWSERLGRWWMEPRWLTGTKGMQSRVRWILRMRSQLRILPFAPTLIVLFVLMGLSIFKDLYDPLLGYEIGWVTWRILRYGQVRGRTLEFKRDTLVIAVKKFVRNSSATENAELLAQLLGHPDPDMRLAAVNGYMEIDPRHGLRALESVREDADRSVANAAKEAYDALAIVATGKSAKSLRPLLELVEEYRQWRREIDLHFFNRGPMRSNLRLVEAQIEEIVYSQIAQRTAFPDLFCTECNARAEQLEAAHWTYVRCKHCMEAKNLELNVRTVIGQIGGQVARQLQDGELRLSVWDEANKEALSAELDVLEIIGGQAMNYDWAASAVVQALQHREDKRSKPIVLRFTSAPNLEQNSRNLLQTLTEVGVGQHGGD